MRDRSMLRGRPDRRHASPAAGFTEISRECSLCDVHSARSSRASAPPLRPSRFCSVRAAPVAGAHSRRGVRAGWRFRSRSRYTRPGSDKPLEKTTYYTRVADQDCGVGYYKD